MAIAGTVIDAAQAGAAIDGVKLDTATIQGAIDTCSAAGGGIVRFPAGWHPTGTLQIRSGVTLRLDQGPCSSGALTPPTTATWILSRTHPVEDLTLKNVTLEAPGGGPASAAGLSLPEKEAAYPEYNMFGKVLPASAVYLRHVRGLELENVRVRTLQPDPRPASVLLDVTDLEGGFAGL